MDTNILVYAIDEISPFHLASRILRDKGIAGEVNLCVCPQVLKEFFAIVTDSKRVTKPRSPKETIEEIEKYLRSENIAKIYPKEDTLVRTINLLKKYNLKTQQVFDVQLVATMLSNSITQLYTYNQEDFLRFGEIEVLTPPN